MGVRAGTVLALAALLAVPAVAEAAGSANVAALQVALRGAGYYSGTVDGVAGAGTSAAVRRFQSRNGLVADGVAGAATRSALGRRGRPAFGSRTMKSGDRGWDVAALQFKLAWRGFPSGSIDGGYGSHLRAAVRRFQDYAGIDGRRRRRAGRPARAQRPDPALADLPRPSRAVADRRPLRPARQPLPHGSRLSGLERDAGERSRSRPRHLGRLGPERLRQPGRDRASLGRALVCTRTCPRSASTAANRWSRARASGAWARPASRPVPTCTSS